MYVCTYVYATNHYSSYVVAVILYTTLYCLYVNIVQAQPITP